MPLCLQCIWPALKRLCTHLSCLLLDTIECAYVKRCSDYCRQAKSLKRRMIFYYINDIAVCDCYYATIPRALYYWYTATMHMYASLLPQSSRHASSSHLLSISRLHTVKVGGLVHTEGIHTIQIPHIRPSEKTDEPQVHETGSTHYYVTFFTL